MKKLINQNRHNTKFIFSHGLEANSGIEGSSKPTDNKPKVLTTSDIHKKEDDLTNRISSIPVPKEIQGTMGREVNKFTREAVTGKSPDIKKMLNKADEELAEAAKGAPPEERENLEKNAQRIKTELEEYLKKMLEEVEVAAKEAQEESNENPDDPKLAEHAKGLVEAVKITRGTLDDVKSFELSDEAKGANSLPNGLQQQIAQKAKSLEGTPYVWGGKSESGCDCSGLVQIATNGKLTGVANDQMKQVSKVDASQAQAGDIVGLRTGKHVESGVQGTTHIGVVTKAEGGNVEVTHASGGRKGGRGVVTESKSLAGLDVGRADGNAPSQEASA